MRALGGAAALLTALWGCGGCASPEAGKGATTSGSTKAGSPADSGPISKPIAARKGSGVPHAGRIVLLALSADGSAAASRDEHGGFRVWHSLDGKTPPVQVTIPGVRRAAVARVGTAIRVAAIDGANGLRIVDVSANGTSKERFALSPQDPSLDVAILGNGRTLRLGTDRQISMLDADGTVLASYSKRMFRPSRLFPSRDGSSVLAVRVDGDGKTDDRISFARIGVTDKGFRAALTQEVTVTGRVDAGRLSASPDGKKLLVVSRTNSWWEVRTVDVLDAKVLSSKVKTWSSRQLLGAGFIDNETVMVDHASNRTAWLYKATDLAEGTGILGHAQRASVYAMAGGVVATGHQHWLHVLEPKGDKSLYLGYQVFSPRQAGIAPSGQFASWITVGSELYVEDLGSREVVKIPPRQGTWTRAHFYDDDHLLVFDSNQGMHLLRWRDGKVLHSSAAPYVAQLEYSMGFLLMTYSNTVYVTRLSVKDGFSRTRAVQANGARAKIARFDGAPALTVVDSSRAMKRYALSDKGPLSLTKLGDTDQLKTPWAVVGFESNGSPVQYSSKAINGERRMVVKLANQEEDEAVSVLAQLSQVVMSPTGTVGYVLAGKSVVAVDFAAGKKIWTSTMGSAIASIELSKDGKRIVISSNSGGRVADAATGKSVVTTCGATFEASSAPPPTVTMQRHMCEL